MSLIYSLTHSHLFFKPKKNLFKLFLAGVSRRIALTFLILFSPVYVYETFTNLGWDGRQAILFVALFFLFIYVGKLISIIFAEDISRKIGFKKTVWLSGLPYFFLILFLYLSLRSPFLVFLAAPFWGMHAGLYWWGYHGYFVKSGDASHFGEGIGEVGFLSSTASIIAPIFGALLASAFGLIVPFFLSGAFIVAALLFIGLNDDRKQKKDTRLADMLALLKKHKLVSASYASFQLESSLYFIIWPLFLFLFFGEVVSLGVVVSLGALFAALFGVIIGRLVDKKGEKKIVSIGAPTLSFSWLVRFVANSMGGFIAADVIRNFGFKLLKVPFDELSYKKAVEGGTANAILFRELSLIFGAVLAAFLVFLWTYLGGGLEKLFLIAGVISAFPLVAVYKRKFHGKR